MAETTYKSANRKNPNHRTPNDSHAPSAHPTRPAARAPGRGFFRFCYMGGMPPGIPPIPPMPPGIPTMPPPGGPLIFDAAMISSIFSSRVDASVADFMA